jgi:hypothetical protein
MEIGRILKLMEVSKLMDDQQLEDKILSKLPVYSIYGLGIRYVKS